MAEVSLGPMIFPERPETPSLRLMAPPRGTAETHLEWEILLLAPGSGADSPFSLPTSLNTGNSGATGSLGQAGNFPTAGGGWECATLQRRGGQASATVNVCV